MSSLACIAVSVPTLVLLQLRARVSIHDIQVLAKTLITTQKLLQKSKFVTNPGRCPIKATLRYRSLCTLSKAPNLISGCTLKTSLFGVGAYVGPFIYETGIFLMTVYKTWKITRTPLMQRLMRE
jgi:hypothetical protein